jgi:hypothetical protein
MVFVGKYQECWTELLLWVADQAKLQSYMLNDTSSNKTLRKQIDPKTDHASLETDFSLSDSV